jgi:AcrR family transcriptional regulator
MIQTAVPMDTVTPTTEHDATRARLLDAAGEVFAEHGFENATVRDICTRAGANIAAVNYHFRDKMGLYLAVLNESVCIARITEMRQIAEQTRSPEEALHLIVSGMIRRMSNSAERGAWHVRIMAHELVHPTAGLDRVVELAISPNYAVLRGVLSQLLGLPPDHDTTRLCAHSVIGQVVHWAHARPVISRVWPELEMTEARLTQIARHITDFSLAGLRSLAEKTT